MVNRYFEMVYFWNGRKLKQALQAWNGEHARMLAGRIIEGRVGAVLYSVYEVSTLTIAYES